MAEDRGRKLFGLQSATFPHGREMALAEELLRLNQCLELSTRDAQEVHKRCTREHERTRE